MDDDSNGYQEFKLYRYTPSTAANVIFILLFAATAMGHIFLLVRRRTWYFIPFVIGCLFEAIGYIGRVMSAKEAPNYTLGPYIMQTLLILLGPALFAASIYMILGRLIRLLGAEEYALVRTSWMTKIFVTGDVLSFLGQSAGGGLMAQAKTADDQQTGENVILGGLGIQILFFGFFIATAIVFHARIAKRPTAQSYSVPGPWKTHILALYAGSVLILRPHVARHRRLSVEPPVARAGRGQGRGGRRRPRERARAAGRASPWHRRELLPDAGGAVAGCWRGEGGAVVAL
ncbi:uncharacterized protein THITE_2109426 [Thermothielavioides terrestris NRRL 8126]|uniref:RTA1 like protein n=1 Tax=Thermothielavioides terrestris (strain ATCC 38088 / NRRL 8126) TaxID=578455 RepID=G2QVQ0_THETT|nr:uncharacterized protein THITE_2109426 [Thermothielavioides terrestris NRRL 8126]AEO63831.1 hypothetical protein THITE_2109426 [Thermothielavioides terrestris NRRL 8126]